MFDERFLGTIGFSAKLLNPFAVIKGVEELSRIDVAECAVFLSEVVGNGRPEIDFENFQRLGNKVAQRKVELIGRSHLLERHAFPESMMLLLKGEAVAAEAVVVDVSKKRLCRNAVIDDETVGSGYKRYHFRGQEGASR